MLTDLHDKLVLKGDFDACEELIEKAVNGKRIKESDSLIFEKSTLKCYLLLTVSVLSSRIGRSMWCFISGVTKDKNS